MIIEHVQGQGTRHWSRFRSVCIIAARAEVVAGSFGGLAQECLEAGEGFSIGLKSGL